MWQITGIYNTVIIPTSNCITFSHCFMSPGYCTRLKNDIQSYFFITFADFQGLLEGENNVIFLYLIYALLKQVLQDRCRCHIKWRVGWVRQAKHFLVWHQLYRIVLCINRLYFIECVILNEGWVGLASSNNCMTTTKVERPVLVWHNSLADFQGLLNGENNVISYFLFIC